MQALVKSRPEQGLWLQEVPEPEIGINDVLIRVERTSICGTDVHIYEWDDWAQQNHSGADGGRARVRGRGGEDGLERVGLLCRRPGQRRGPRRVRALPQLPGRTPAPLRAHDGRGREPARRFRRVHLAAHDATSGTITATIPRDIASLFDPFGNAVHTALSFPVLGEDVLITGAGPIGMMAAAVVRHAGARYVVITDVNPKRLELAEKFGVTRAVDVRSTTLADVQKELGMQEGFDVGLEMSGNEAAFRDMLANMSHGGQHCHARHPARSRCAWTGTRSFSTCSPSRASTAARCTRPGTR